MTAFLLFALVPLGPPAALEGRRRFANFSREEGNLTCLPPRRLGVNRTVFVGFFLLGFPIFAPKPTIFRAADALFLAFLLIFCVWC